MKFLLVDIFKLYLKGNKNKQTMYFKKQNGLLLVLLLGMFLKNISFSLAVRLYDRLNTQCTNCTKPDYVKVPLDLSSLCCELYSLCCGA